LIIKTVTIKNIKKYDDITYNFTEGIQLILGPNGSGKSTIIESIGWVVFDHLEYKLANWLKWGKDVGFVTVIIYDKENNISYEVFRSTGGEYKITSRGKVLATGVQDVQSYIKKLLNIIDEPAKIFRDIIGVSQEMMASQFSLSASYKKKIFDPILGIEKFSKMWSLLKPVETLLESKMINIEIEKAKIDGWINSANSFKDDYEIKKTELAVIVSDIGTLRSEMNSINEILNTLIEQKNKYDELKRVENEIKIVEGEGL
jgi:exonuclease SbcC